MRSTFSAIAVRPALAVLTAAALAMSGAPRVAAASGALVLEEVARVGQPTDIVRRGDDRLYVVSQRGQVWLLEAAGDGEPFLDLGSRLAHGPEQGLLSMAFEPAAAVAERFYVTYTRAGDGASVISRFVVEAASPEQVSPDGEEVLLVVPQPGPNHNVNLLRFGPDGYLYVAIGDGELADEPPCTAQQGDVLRGKILRLDVRAEAGYAVPADNPFVGDPAMRGEIWAFGLRNPWRMSFDRATGDLFIADPGQQGPEAREEIDIHPAGSPAGRNYGWKMMEGTRCRGLDRDCAVPPPACGDPRYTPPAIEYLHDAPSRCAVIGGFVYRGEAIPALAGAYVLGDYCGQLWVAWPAAGTFRLEAMGPHIFGITTFGEDAAGELLVATAAGVVYRITGVSLVPDCQTDAETLCLAGGRFRATARWRTVGGRSGRGQAVPLEAASGPASGPAGGWFWFFRPGNPEIFVKVLDACSGPLGHFWVFAGGMTDVEVSLEVVDTATGESRVYGSDLGVAFGTIRDTRAFDTCATAR